MINTRNSTKALYLSFSALLVLSACQSMTQSQQSARPVSVAPTSAAAATSASPKSPSNANSASGWQQDWNETLAAAKREGKLVISGQPGDAYRLPLTQLFERTYPGISVEYTGLAGQNFLPRVYEERAAGQYLWDLRIGGPDPAVYKAVHDGTLAPIRPLLILPEVTDDSSWIGGLNELFSDDAKQFAPAFTASASVSNFVDRAVLPENILSSQKQLVDPQFKGKIGIADPRGGSGLGQLTLLLAGYGEGFVIDLLSKQALATTLDLNQLAEWIVRGRNPIALGLPKFSLERYSKEGLGANVKPLAGPLGLTYGGGGIQLLSQAPHPNAAKVYVNWVLGRDAQAAIAKSTVYNSRRADIPLGDPDAAVDPAQVSEYIVYQSEKQNPMRQRADELVKRYLPS